MVARAQEERYTFDGFLRAYEGRHAEWHPDGRVEELMGVSLTHLRVVEFLIVLFSFYKRLHPDVRAIFAPFPVRVEGLPAREPDLIVLVGEVAGRLHETYLDGAPEIAVEVVSHESRLRDYEQKTREYHAAGVREYWIIDPAWQRVDVLEWQPEGYRPRPTTPDGTVTSGVLPAFALPTALLWGDDSPDPLVIMRVVEAMG